jgi:hypothetical protein
MLVRQGGLSQNEAGWKGGWRGGEQRGQRLDAMGMAAVGQDETGHWTVGGGRRRASRRRVLESGSSRGGEDILADRALIQARRG